MINFSKYHKIYFSFLFIWLYAWIMTSSGSELAGSYKAPISLTGLIEPAETLEVHASVGGRVEVIHVTVNQTVAKDQLLLSLKNSSQKRQLELSNLQLRINQNNVRDKERQLELAKVQVEVNQNNVKDKEHQLKLAKIQIQVNENNVTDRKEQLELAQIQIKVNENNVKDSKKKLELAKVQVEVSANNVKDMETNLKDIKRRLDDEETLFEQGSSTRSQLDALQLQYNRGKLSLENTKLALKRTEQEIKRSQIGYENSMFALERSKKEISRSQLGVNNAILTLERSKMEIGRTQLGVKNTILTLERSRQDMKRSELGVENGRITLERTKHDVALSEEALEDTRIKAKIGGIITAKLTNEGEMIGPGSPLFHIIDIKQVKIVVQAEEQDLPMIKEGQKVVFVTPSYRDKQFSGFIERVDWTADPETGRFPLHVKAENPGLALRAGMTAKVYLLSK